MTTPATSANLLARLEGLGAPELRRLLVEHLTKRKLGLYWESDAIARDEALNADVVLPRHVPELSYQPAAMTADASYPNLIIEGDNFDALRLLKSTHAGRIRVIYIDPPYNTGNKDWVYNDRYVGANDRWRHSQWLEFLYQRLTLARDLLTPDGVILVSINDENRSRLEMLMDEVFPGRRLGSLVWRTKDTGNDLSQRFSHVHEHVLVYANPGFKFNGRPTDRSKFRNSDNDPRGEWSPQPLTKAHTYTDRENTYYPIQNPETEYWYPCDPDSVWRFASEQEIRKRLQGDVTAIAEALAGLRSDTIEQLIDKKLIYFPPCKAEDVMRFDSRDALLAAIHAGKGPMLPKKKTPLLREDLPDLDFWIGKPIAPGRPSRKEHWTARPEEERLAPLSSWIAGINEEVVDEEDALDAIETLRTTRGGVATDEVKAILGSKAFSYPKPISLLKGLLGQTSKPGDIVLDFFAGSGTTGQAVLELNSADEGRRRYILCSSTEATVKDPNKNICRDVCAERLRRVSAGYADKPGFGAEQGGAFAYLQMDKVGPADIPFEATPPHAFTLLSLRLTHAISTFRNDAVQLIARAGDCDILLCVQVDSESITTLSEWSKTHGVARIAVYSERPESLKEAMELRGVDAACYGLYEALRHGQTGGAA
jgi:adenine-specific DNA-methyltransferase